MKLDDVKKLQQKKYRNQFQCYLIEGEHLALELEKLPLSAAAEKQCELFVTEQYQDWPTRLRKTLISSKKMAAISDTKTPQGIIAVVPFDLGLPAAQKPAKAIYLNEVQDPGNLGTIIRTLGWFGGLRCLLSHGSVDPYNPKVVRSSMGAIFHVDIEQDVSLETLAQQYPRLATLDMNGSALSDKSFGQFDAYVFGNEARGVPREALAPYQVTPFTIGGSGAIESLNLASAVNMCVYELNRG